MIVKLLGVGAVLLSLTGAAQAQYYYSGAPVYAAPAVTYVQPGYYAPPVYAAPVYAAPVYAAPVYAAPVYGYGGYGGYYSPFSIGLNFGFGGRGFGGFGGRGFR